ncbi:MAG: nuclear transport factor 2 family protein [Gemmatirosa sp.]|nr:nuclear transport factor 2 family protein [Gemmatirosa sp.]
MTEDETNCATVARLMGILAGHAPIESGIELIAPDVVAHVDGWRFQGINVWANWIHYIRTRGRVGEPTLVLDAIVVEHDATVTARSRWCGDRHGRPVTSRPCSARYRVHDGQIVEIWSTRRNYAFLCGAHLAHRSGFAVELLRAWRWKTRAPQLDLTGGARLRSVAGALGYSLSSSPCPTLPTSST